MPRRTGALLFALAFGPLVWVAGLPEAAAAPQSPDPSCSIELPDLPSVEGEPPGSMVAAGARLVRAGELDAAEHVYERALAVQTPDGRAEEGLVRVEAQREAAALLGSWGREFAAEAKSDVADRCFTAAESLDVEQADAETVTDDTTSPQDDAKRWDDFSAAWVAPLGRVLLPVLAVLAVLLVMARLATPLVVRTADKAPVGWVRRSLWWSGLALLTATALVVAVIGPFASGYGTSSHPWIAEVVVIALLVIALLLMAAALSALAGISEKRRSASYRRHRDVVPLGAIVVASALLIATVSRSWLAWPAAAVVGAAGVLSFAAGRGHALRLYVRVTKGKDDDPAAAAAVLARLHELGTAPPRGLKAPQQVDVTDLPEAALKVLPAGTVTTALTSVLGLVLPSVPWRAMISDDGDDRLVVTLTRNGRVAGSAVIDPGRLWREVTEPPAEAEKPAAEPDPRDLLTAAAAFILAELADRHRLLKDGLCGASRWASIAAQVTASLPGTSAEERRRFLAFAVNRDPANALALVAYTAALGEDAATVPELEEDIDRLSEVKKKLESQLLAPSDSRPAHLPVHARVRHMIAASRLNIVVQTANDRTRRLDDWNSAVKAHAELVEVLDHKVGEGSRVYDFITDMRGVAGELCEAFDALDKPYAGTSRNERALAWKRQGTVSLDVLYDRACIGALSRVPSRQDEALRALELAVGDDGLRAAARTDPWLARLRDEGADPGRRKKTWRLLGAAPAPAFTDLATIGTKGNSLRDMGLVDSEDVLEVTVTPGACRELARRLEVPTAVVVRWQQLADLAVQRKLDTRALALFEKVGVRSLSELNEALDGLGTRPLFDKLTAAADQADMRPPEPTEFTQWTGRTLPGPHRAMRWLTKEARAPRRVGGETR